jgi:hypothetical protein
VNLEAEVLSVNDRVLDGRIRGGFLSGPNGSVSETNIVGVKFNFLDEMYLEDFKLKYAVLAYHKDKQFIPLEAKLKHINFGGLPGDHRITVSFYCEGDFVGSRIISKRADGVVCDEALCDWPSIYKGKVK